LRRHGSVQPISALSSRQVVTNPIVNKAPVRFPQKRKIFDDSPGSFVRSGKIYSNRTSTKFVVPSPKIGKDKIFKIVSPTRSLLGNFLKVGVKNNTMGEGLKKKEIEKKIVGILKNSGNKDKQIKRLNLK